MPPYIWTSPVRPGMTLQRVRCWGPSQPRRVTSSWVRGRGPTVDIFPRRMRMNWRNSSRAVARSHLPTRVTFPSRMVRNFQTVKGRLCFPSRVWVKRMGPRSSSRMRSGMMARMGENMRRAVRATRMSNILIMVMVMIMVGVGFENDQCFYFC